MHREREYSYPGDHRFDSVMKEEEHMRNMNKMKQTALESKFTDVIFAKIKKRSDTVFRSMTNTRQSGLTHLHLHRDIPVDTINTFAMKYIPQTNYLMDHCAMRMRN